MKPKHLFWGLFFVLFGLLILLNNFSSFNIDFGSIWKFWPVIIILWGISYIINTNFIKVLFAAITGIILALVVFSAAQSFLNIFDKNINFDFSNDDKYSYADTVKFNEPFKPNIKNADLIIDAGAGLFKITETTDELISVLAQGDKNNYSITRNDSDDDTYIELKMKKAKFMFNKKSTKNKFELSLNPNPIWNINIDVGAASANFDLSPYKISSAKLDVGAASMQLKLGDKHSETIVDIDAGVSSIKILIPDSSGCEINSSTTLSSKHFKDFKKIDKKLYRTENFETAKNKIYLHVDAGFSSINVKRYSKEW